MTFGRSGRSKGNRANQILGRWYNGNNSNNKRWWTVCGREMQDKFGVETIESDADETGAK